MELTIQNLNYLCRSYDGLNKLLVSTKNRRQILNPDLDISTDWFVQSLESDKGKLSRKIEKELQYWEIWEEWMINIKGIGPFIAGNLILTYYYRFMPICPKCETKVEKKDNTFWCNTCERSVKGDGLSTYAIENRDFPNVGKWWHFMGRHVVDGKMPKRKKGEKTTWSTKNRTLGFQIGDQINRQNGDHLYKKFMLERKKKREQTHPEASKGHRHNMARNETIKLFLSHFWHVARTLEGKSTEGPYAEVILGHTGIIVPYYWEQEIKKAA